MDVADEEDFGENSSGSQSIISFSASVNKLGMAWYNEIRNEILVDTILMSTDDLEDVLNSIKVECSPTLLLIPSKILSNKQLVNLLISRSIIVDSGSRKYHEAEKASNNYSYFVPKSSTYHSETAKELCSQLIVRNMMTSSQLKLNYYENYHKIASKIPIDDNLIMQSLGALLHYIKSNILSLDDDMILISSLGEFHKKKFLKIDENSLRSLQIFSQDMHPNLLKDRTNSLPGRYKLKEWMLKPFNCPHLINERLNFVSMMMNSSNKDFQQELIRLLRHMHDLSKIILRLKKVEATSSDWIKLQTSLEQSTSILRLCLSFINDDSRDESDKRIIQTLVADIDLEKLDTVKKILLEAIDFKASAQNGQLVIRDGYDKTLDNARNKYDSLPKVLKDATNEILNQVPLLTSIAVEYFPQIGYLVAIQNNNEYLQSILAVARQNTSNEQFSFVYKNDNTFFFKHSVVEELDETIGDVASVIKDRQKILLLALEETILDAEVPILAISWVCAALDATISLGTISNEMRFVRPEFVEDNIIVIKNGRHPLQEMTVESFISNDTFITQDKNIALITGPNNSGKSVYVKQVGTIIYLAHIGCFVPCERAVLGLVDAMYTRISSTETASSPLSAFSADLAQVSKMLSSASARSVCLLDEFGKGTTPTDGVSILAATISKLIDLKSRTLCALHFTEILDDTILSVESKSHINVFRMDVHSTDRDNSFNDEDIITPLYKVRLGMSPSSEGLGCAKAAGINLSVIQRAGVIKQAILNHALITPIMFKDHMNTSINRDILCKFLTNDAWSNSSDEEICQFKEMLS